MTVNNPAIIIKLMDLLKQFYLFNFFLNSSGFISISLRISRIKGLDKSLPGWLGNVVVLPSECL